MKFYNFLKKLSLWLNIKNTKTQKLNFEDIVNRGNPVNTLPLADNIDKKRRAILTQRITKFGLPNIFLADFIFYLNAKNLIYLDDALLEEEIKSFNAKIVKGNWNSKMQSSKSKSTKMANFAVD